MFISARNGVKDRKYIDWDINVVKLEIFCRVLSSRFFTCLTIYIHQFHILRGFKWFWATFMVCLMKIICGYRYWKKIFLALYCGLNLLLNMKHQIYCYNHQDFGDMIFGLSAIFVIEKNKWKWLLKWLLFGIQCLFLLHLGHQGDQCEIHCG